MFSSTWPNPLYIVPKIAVNEMRTLKGTSLPVVIFDTIESCHEQVLMVADHVNRGIVIGGYIPRTIIVDNMTSAIMTWKDQIKPDTQDRLDWDGWAKLASNINGMMQALHSISTHTIWIAHSKLNTIKVRGVGNKIEEVSIGGYTIEGSAKNLIPSHCDILLYTETTSNLKGVQYWIHTQKYEIWPAGSRVGNAENPLPRKIGPNPHYDDFAPYLELPSLEEEERK